jgi:hypothetical protein
MGWRTLGVRDLMRVPRPAARITAFAWGLGGVTTVGEDRRWLMEAAWATLRV